MSLKLMNELCVYRIGLVLKFELKTEFNLSVFSNIFTDFLV